MRPREAIVEIRQTAVRRQDMPVIAIVGAGFSGTMAAVHLRRRLSGAATIWLFDRSGRFARGPAYAASALPHLLNVRSMNMSAFADEPVHFEAWLKDHLTRRPADWNEVADTEAGRFATRRLYGRYLRQLLYRELREGGGRVALQSSDVERILPDAGGWRLWCANGRVLRADIVVLAGGNLAPAARGDGVVFHNPWDDAAATGLRPGEPVMIVGTGLTMVDLALAMQAGGFAGPIIAVSRRGLVPQPHVFGSGGWPAPEFTDAERGSLVGLLRRIRREFAAAATAGIGWRAVIDGLRPVTASLWRNLPGPEQRRFLRHLRPFWDVHRHRMAPPIAAALAAMRASGALTLRRGRVRSVVCEAGRAHVTIDTGGPDGETISVQRLVYATGARAAGESDSLIASLCMAGLVRLDDHGMGLQVDGQLRIVAPDGRVTPGLWALGPVVRGTFWECTAVPDVRVQASHVADAIAAWVRRQGD